MKTSGEWLRATREGMSPSVSLRTMAQRLEISPMYLSDIENDRRRPSEALCEKIAEWYALPLDDVCARSGVLGSKTEMYFRKSAAAIHLMRLIARKNLSEKELLRLRATVGEYPFFGESA